MRRVIYQFAVGILVAASAYAVGHSATHAGPSQVLSIGDRTVRDETPKAEIKVVETFTSPVKSTPDRVAEASTRVDPFGPVAWSSDLELALSRAKRDGRLVLLFVTPSADT